jgi:hypothetical protein
MHVQGINSRLAVRDITLHLIDVNFPLHLTFVMPSIHLQVHDMPCHSLRKSSVSMTTLDDRVRNRSLDPLLRCVRPER